LVFGDPQLEGDTSLPKPSDLVFPSLHSLWGSDEPFDINTVLAAFVDCYRRDIPRFLWSYRKRLDLLGNDYYLAHIYRALHWWSEPTHVAVLGDLLGSQWISDEEFSRRAHRYWTRVFVKGTRVEDDIMQRGSTETLGADPAWATRIINVAGNHDIGYSGDITAERMQRFQEAFGVADWDVRFQVPNSTDSTSSLHGPPEIRIVVLNSMTLDGPAHDTGIQDDTYAFINNRLIGKARPVEDTRSATILLTHVPLHKRVGVCVDAPMIKYRPNGVLQEQNHLSAGVSRSILEGVFGMSGAADAPMSGLGRNGLILTGHDHEGCDVWHHVAQSKAPAEEEQGKEDEHPWAATRFSSSSAALPRPGIREITVRSMMGAYGGNAGLLSGWFDVSTQQWKFEYATCPIGVQHWWWAVHVLDCVVILLGLGAAVTSQSRRVVERDLGMANIKGDPVLETEGVAESSAGVVTGSDVLRSSAQRRGRAVR